MIEILLAAVAFVYLSACFARVPSSAWRLKRGFFGWSAAPALSNAGSGFSFIGLFPWENCFFVHPWMFGPEPGRIYAGVFENPNRSLKQISDYGFVSLSESMKWEEDSLRFGAARFAKHDLINSQLLWLEEYRQADVPTRGRILDEEIERRLNMEAIRRRINDFFKHTRLLRFLSNTLFLIAFALIPAVYFFERVSIFFPWIYLSTLILPAIWFTFYRAHGRLLPNQPGRIKQTIALILSPMNSMRASEVLSANLLGGFHPITAIVALLEPDNARPHAETILRDLTFPLSEGPRGFGGQWASRVMAFLQENDMIDLLSPPGNLKSDRSYCPRCLARYARLDGNCADCEIKLLRFD